MDLKYLDKKKFLLENYRSIGLNEQQLIVLLLCLHEDVIFKIDYDKLKEVMNLNPDEVTSLLSDLFKNNLLTVTLSKVEGKHVEVIDSSKLYEVESGEEEVNVFAEIEHCFGKSLSNKEVQVISKWMSTKKYKYDEILEAFGIAAINNVKNINYVEKVLENNSTNDDKEDITPISMQYNWLEDE